MTVAGHAVQVVTSADGSWSVDTEALLRVTEREELRGLPVAVVSVAGAARGGKSFLLDFLLRYLTSTAAERLDGSWLGDEKQSLDGFSWSGGCDRHTNGIHLWSEPILLTKEDGQDVVVVLMDTQGTFDSVSTTRDSTTVFALATLLSSVQIFNLSQNIQEDHLQYLQLFTEYGKLATENTGVDKPFQDLQFLVRDWSYAYQHPVGAVGGQQLLNKRLEMVEGQAEELREVREHIHSCFESARCFLMPHPGLTVATSPNFTGCLSDISTEFKKALLELVHVLFEENMPFKKINGQQVHVQDLVTYFESYMEVFNSDQLPTPVTILKGLLPYSPRLAGGLASAVRDDTRKDAVAHLPEKSHTRVLLHPPAREEGDIILPAPHGNTRQATSSACLEAAVSAARALYVERMEVSTGGRDAPPRSTSRDAVARLHDAARDAARENYVARRTLAEAQLTAQRLDSLLQELDNHLPYFNALNSERLQSTLAACRLRYQEHMDVQHCLAGPELEERHLAAVDLALSSFDEARLQGGQDDDRTEFVIELESNRLQMQEKNEAKIKAAIDAACKEYEEGFCQDVPVSRLCVKRSDLPTLSRAAKNWAMELFQSRWTSEESAQNEHRTTLLNILDEKFIEITSQNERNNDKAVAKALSFYNNYMTTLLGSEKCLHPLDLQAEHGSRRDAAVAALHRSRTYGDEGTGRDDHFLHLIKSICRSFTEHQELNQKKNSEAVTKAHNFYKSGMNTRRNLDPVQNVFMEFLGLPDFDVLQRHQVEIDKAVDMFKHVLRRPGPDHVVDEHLDQLKKLIDKSYTRIKVMLGIKFGASIGSAIALPAYFGFLRR